MTDLTKITTPFGLLDPETQEALRAHGGPWEWYSDYDGWRDGGAYPPFVPGTVYRVKPAPPKPREWWAFGNCLHETREEVWAAWGPNAVPTKVREVLE